MKIGSYYVNLEKDYKIKCVDKENHILLLTGYPYVYLSYVYVSYIIQYHTIYFFKYSYLFLVKVKNMFNALQKN